MKHSRVRYSGQRFQVMQKESVAGSSCWEFVSHPGSVVILPVVDRDQVCLIKSHRWALDETLYELPAGTLNEGENPLHAARRELKEETGYHADTWEEWADFYTSPGILDERMHLFVATGLTPGQMQLEPYERIEPVVVSTETAFRWIASRKIRDAKTLVGLLFYQANQSGTIRPQSLDKARKYRRD